MDKVSNKEVLEKVAEDVLQTKNKEVIEAFVNQLLYTSMLNN